MRTPRAHATTTPRGDLDERGRLGHRSDKRGPGLQGGEAETFSSWRRPREPAMSGQQGRWSRCAARDSREANTRPHTPHRSGFAAWVVRMGCSPLEQTREPLADAREPPARQPGPHARLVQKSARVPVRRRACMHRPADVLGRCNRAAHIARGPAGSSPMRVRPPDKPFGPRTWLVLSRARALAHSAGGACLHAPTHTRAVHGYKDSPDLCRCGGTDSRAAVGHMPGSCLCASVHALLTGSLGAQRARSRRRIPHIGGMCKQGFLPARLPLQGVLPHGDVSTGAEATLASRGGDGRNTFYALRALELTFQ